MRLLVASLIFLLVGCEAKVAVKSEPVATQTDIATLKNKITQQQTEIDQLKKSVPVVPTALTAKMRVPLKATTTPTGVVVSMSDGTTQVFPLGVWIEFASGAGCNPACPGGNQLRGIFPTQYVNQIATVHTAASGTGTGATATATVTSPTSLSFSVTSGGTAYLFPVITVTGGTGNPGLVTATLSGGVITAISAINSSGYTVGDTLTVTITDTPAQTWTYTRPGRNVQVWRNGLLQRLATCSTDAATCGGDYVLNTATMTITPIPVTLGNGMVVPNWNTDDYVTVAYLF